LIFPPLRKMRRSSAAKDQTPRTSTEETRVRHFQTGLIIAGVTSLARIAMSKLWALAALLSKNLKSSSNSARLSTSKVWAKSSWRIYRRLTFRLKILTISKAMIKRRKTMKSQSFN
jgi:hypothetical protein